ncbi:MAG: nucleoside deaminase [Clostridia bacterium]|nr:nucleoside deaminase [Clostridia bacterium]
MRLALAESEKAFAVGEVPVGAVVVQNGEVIASAHNLTEQLSDASAHAEMLALKQAAERLGTRRLSGCELYVTLEPCAMCMGAILNFRIGALCFGAFDDAAGCTVSRCELARLTNQGLPFVGGMLEDECRSILSRFFSERREQDRSARICTHTGGAEEQQTGEE